MSQGKRIQNIIAGLFMLLAAAILFLLGSDGFKFIMDVISITFIISGLNQIIF